MDHNNASDTYESIENLIGTTKVDTLTGNAGQLTTLTVEAGADAIDGGAGDDIIDGRDNTILMLKGGEGNDTLVVGEDCYACSVTAILKI